MINLGSDALAKAYVGELALDRIYVGAQQLWSNFTQQGMDKNGSQSLSLNSWTQVVNWSVRSGFETTITSHGLSVPAGVTVNLAAQTYRGGAHSGNQTRIVANGVVIATGSGGTREASVTLNAYTPTVDVLLTVEAIATSSLGDRDIINAGSNSYLTAVPV